MKNKKIKLSILLLSLGLALQAQQTSTATGGSASGSGGTVTYSVGQVAYTTNQGANGTVAQGVQQPFEISVVTGNGNNNINLEIVAYPNPTTDFLTLNINNYDLTNFSYQLFDAGGKIIESRKITSVSETIRMGKLPGGIYFLRVINNNQTIKTFKIIKN
jgi:hypothetical protein